MHTRKSVTNSKFVFTKPSETVSCLLCCSQLMSGFFACFLVRDLCRSGCRHNYPHPHHAPPLCFCFYPRFSLFNTSVSYLKSSARLKLVSVPFSSLLLYIGRLERVSIVQSRFIWLNGSMTLIRAEIERYNIVAFSKVSTKSLASGAGS